MPKFLDLEGLAALSRIAGEGGLAESMCDARWTAWLEEPGLVRDPIWKESVMITVLQALRGG